MRLEGWDKLKKLVKRRDKLQPILNIGNSPGDGQGRPECAEKKWQGIILKE
jgi:hypothetical protein